MESLLALALKNRGEIERNDLASKVGSKYRYFTRRYGGLYFLRGEALRFGTSLNTSSLVSTSFKNLLLHEVGYHRAKQRQDSAS